MSVDVAVIGAGPAGSTLAALLAARGRRVALIDRDTFPRDKLCGEFLSYDALPLLEELGVLREIVQRGAPEIAHCRVVGSQRTYAFDFPRAARGVSRLLLDDLLYRTAVARGAVGMEGWTAESMLDGVVRCNAVEPSSTVVPSTVVPPTVVPPPTPAAGLNASAPSGTAEAGITGTSDVTTVRAKVIAGAWGRWGRFDQQLARAFVRDRTHRNFGFKRHYRLAAADPDDSVIELYSFRRGYLGVSDIEGGLTNVCGLVHASRLAQHKGRWDAFVARIREEEPRLETMYARLAPAQEQFLSSEPVIFRARSAVENGVFMIGDASGVIDPLTGNGMAMAIQSAFLAAPFLERALDENDRERAENDYRERHRSTFAPRIAWSRRIAFLLSRPRMLDAALSGLRSRTIGEFLLRRTRGAAGG